MPKAFYHEQQVKAGDEIFRLVINFRALDAIEAALDKGFDEILPELKRVPPKLSVVAQVVWGLLREHHPETTIDEASSLMFGEPGTKIGMAVTTLLAAAFDQDDETKAKGKNPRKPRGASKPS